MRTERHGTTPATPTGTAPKETQQARYGPGDRYAEPLLDAAGEVEAAREIEAGLYAQHLLDTRTDLPAALAGEYRQLSREGTAARERMILANLRLVTHWTSRRIRGGTGGELEFDELFNEGVAGLARAVAKFDYARGLKFSTYASTWIRSLQQRAVWQARAVRLPDHLEQLTAELRRARSELATAGIGDPDPVQLAAHAGVSVAKVTALLAALRGPIRLDAPVSGTDGNTVLLELLPDAAAGHSDPDGQLWDRVRDAIETLPARSRSVLLLRTGLGAGPGVTGSTPLTQQQVAARLGVSQAAVGKVEAAALAQLRAALGVPGTGPSLRGAGRSTARRAA